ncbi:hypothetical protein BLOT_003512 [Blomia tropicalis]|nr:hypothetical protein BLOT_003512 [Blomia tropicalis]
MIVMGPNHGTTDLSSNIYGDRSIPQIDLLPMVDQFITHDDDGTLLEAILFGRSVIVCPLFDDQYDDANRVEEKGFSRQINSYPCNNDELRSMIVEICDDNNHLSKRPRPDHIYKIKRKPPNEIEDISNLTVNVQSNEVLNKYLVHTDQCTIIRRPLYDKESIKFIKKYKNKEYECNHRSLADKIVRVNATTVYIPSLLKGCQARLIERNILTDDVKFGRKKTDLSEFTDFENADAVQIECSGNLKRVIPLVPFKQPSRWPNIPIVQSEYPNNFRPNVIMIGIDAVSRLNFLRHFPQSNTFMDSKRFQSMLGHHKVGDNTLPNLFAMFLGEQQSTWWKQLPHSKKLDSLPFIFKYFSNANYLTTYIEDYPYCGLLCTSTDRLLSSSSKFGNP